MSFFENLENLIDTRKDINIEYNLADIVFLTMAAVLSGAKGWKAIEIFGHAQLNWLRQYRDFSSGIPTRHSIGRIIRGIKSESFVACFIQWVNQIRDSTNCEHIAFDGKVLRGSKRGTDVHALQLMTAMIIESGLVVYQKETSCKTNEIPVMQSMLSDMDVKGAVITADAMHCQTETAKRIREGGGDYVLQIKANQNNLLKAVQAYFHKVYRDEPQLLEKPHYQELDGEHGRINERYYRVLPITDWLSEAQGFEDSCSIIEVQRTRTIKEKASEETYYYISSIKDNKQKISQAIRGHWGIENSQHWVLDVTFREDECQIYAEDGAKNLASMRRVLLNMVKQHPLKDSVAGKLQRASWDGHFRAAILFGQKMSKV